jgi:leucyl/phenylalanyl-tRNA--protein transferase
VEWSAPPAPVGPSAFAFLPPDRWPPDDLIAVGGDLSPSTILDAYRHGVFPMVLDASEPQPILGWWSPDPRGILPLDGLRVTRSMRQSFKRFDIRVDTSFVPVVRACADPSRESRWITEDFVEAYAQLHALGWAHSVEVFDREGALAGGLYGLRIGRLFAGESMFHRQRDASKVALMALVDLMKQSGLTLLDVQWRTEHLQSLGAIAVPREEYLRLLSEALS